MAENKRAGRLGSVPATRGTNAPAARPSVSGSSSVGSERLSIMPLAVLLPRLSDVSVLPSLAPQLERRLSLLQNRGAHHEGAEGADQDVRVLEESMLMQVLQWVRMSSEQE